MKTSPFIPFLTAYEKTMPFYMSTIGVSNNSVFRPYGIDDCQLLYVISGKGEAIINNVTYELKENSILYLPPDTLHHYYPTTESWVTNYITFNGSGTSDFKKMSPFVQSTPTSFDFQHWYKILYNYKYSPNHEKSLSITLYATLLEFRDSISISSPSFEKKKIILMSAMHEMVDNCDLSLSDISQKLNMSEEHFCRTFKSCTGFRPLEYLNFLKIQRAKELLKSTDKDMTEITRLAGYSSPSYFTMLFKRYTGTTPKKYRNL